MLIHFPSITRTVTLSTGEVATVAHYEIDRSVSVSRAIRSPLRRGDAGMIRRAPKRVGRWRLLGAEFAYRDNRSRPSRLMVTLECVCGTRRTRRLQTWLAKAWTSDGCSLCSRRRRRIIGDKVARVKRSNNETWLTLDTPVLDKERAKTAGAKRRIKTC